MNLGGGGGALNSGMGTKKLETSSRDMARRHTTNIHKEPQEFGCKGTGRTFTANGKHASEVCFATSRNLSLCSPTKPSSVHVVF